jgi:alanine racemase
MPILNALKKLKKSWDPYQPLIEVRIFRDNILHNLHAFQRAVPRLQFAPVLKSNAYGHGLIEVATILDKEKLPFFMVDSLFEARQLRHEGIKTPVLILGYVTADNVAAARLKDIAFAVISLEQLKIISRTLKRPASFHIKIDTGMRRQGLMPEELDEAITIIKKNKMIALDGICSHLADADGETGDTNLAQIQLWNELVVRLEQELGAIRFQHLTNSAGSDLAPKITANVVRLGIGLYGFNLSPRSALELKPALRMETIISSIRALKPKESVGYNLTFTAPKPMVIATIPVGYTEGLDRRLSNSGAVIVGNVSCPIVGRVSMNMASIDVTKVADARLEQKVTVLSENPNDPNSINSFAKLCQTIPYDLLVHIPAQLKRTVV